jgi:hypothetical protein
MTDHPHLVVATPCFGGQVTAAFMAAIMRLQEACWTRQLDFAWIWSSGDALITRARADLLARFLDRPQYTHLLFIDADIDFEPSQVFRLLAFEADVAAGAYPIKTIDWNRVRAAIAAGRDPTSAALAYVCDIEQGRIITRNGFVKSRYAGCGFLMISRPALTRLCAAHPELQYQRIDMPSSRSSVNQFALFECMIDPESGTYLSEDYAFCRRWAALGGEIWIDMESRLTHIGPMPFVGDFATQFHKRPAAKMPPDMA